MFKRVIFCFAVLITIGLPFDTPWHYLYGIIIAGVLVFGTLRQTLQTKYLIIGLCSLLGAYFVPNISILEQQRLLVEHNSTIITPGEFIKSPEKYPFSQTADGYAQGTGLSRKVRDISLFNAPYSLRSGYVNTYNFYGPPLT